MSNSTSPGISDNTFGAPPEWCGKMVTRYTFKKNFKKIKFNGEKIICILYFCILYVVAIKINNIPLPP